MDYKKYLSIDVNKRFGKPHISGTRISVADVLGWFANGMDVQEIIQDYPELSEKQIMACLAYAADREHRVRVAS
jgi:uncharacterized protein (DUF433 family)